MSSSLIKEVTKLQQYVELHKYEHIVFGVIRAIENEKYTVGDKLPSFHEMHEMIGYSRETIYKGYKCLIEQGLVKSVKYKGYFIINTKIKAVHTIPLESLTPKTIL